jgi:small subunit ribosomal protein S3Ae
MAKKWFKVLAPKIFNSVEVGQTFSEEGKDLIGRKITVPLSRLMDDRGKQYVTVDLRISEIKGNSAETVVRSFKISRAHLVRYVRRRSSRIDSIDDVEAKDNKKMRVKSLLITAFKATRKQRYSLRKALSQEIRKELKEYTADAFLLAVSVGKLQMKIKKKLNKIYPIRYSEIRVIEMR